MRVEFRLTDEAYRTAPPFGPDLDNLLKPLLDMLKRTVLERLGDECVVSLRATKSPAGTGGQTGVLLEIENVPGPGDAS